MSSYYKAFGLIIKVSRAIPGMVKAKDDLPIDIGIDLEGHLEDDEAKLRCALLYESPRDKKGNVLHVWRMDDEEGFFFEYSDGLRFKVDRSGGKIHARWQGETSFDDMVASLLGPVIGLAMRLKGSVCLHASAFALGERAIALMAPSGVGKSTLAARFAQLGNPVLTDDFVSISEKGGKFLVRPGYPRLKLRPDSQEVLDGLPGLMPRFSPLHTIRDKRYIDLMQGLTFQEQSLNLAAVYSADLKNSSDRPHIEKVTGQEAIITLLSNLYVFPLIDKSKRLQDFDVIHRIAGRVPMRKIRFRRDLKEVPRLCQAVLDDIERLNAKP